MESSSSSVAWWPLSRDIWMMELFAVSSVTVCSFPILVFSSSPSSSTSSVSLSGCGMRTPASVSSTSFPFPPSTLLPSISPSSPSSPSSLSFPSPPPSSLSSSSLSSSSESSDSLESDSELSPWNAIIFSISIRFSRLSSRLAANCSLGQENFSCEAPLSVRGMAGVAGVLLD